MREYVYRGRILNLALEGPFELVEHRPAVALLAEREGHLLFVRQYRPAVGKSTLEIPAGLIEPGETPLEAARRELAEEAQLTGSFEHLASFYASPGFTDERIDLFQVRELTPAEGTPDEGEELEVLWLDPKEVLEGLRQGRLAVSASTLVGLLWYLHGAARASR